MLPIALMALYLLLSSAETANAPTQEADIQSGDEQEFLEEVSSMAGFTLLGAMCPIAMNAASKAIPKAANSRLQGAIRQLFKKADKIPGGTAGAIREELRTGTLVGGKSHLLKGQQRITQLQRILREENLSPADRATAGKLYKNFAGCPSR